MEFKELIEEFAKRYNIEGLNTEDGISILDIDGITVTLVNVEEIQFVATAEIGEPPAEGKADFAEMLLAYNMQSQAFFAKNENTGKYMAIRRMELATLDADKLETELENLLNLAETWRKLLEDFRPMAKDAAAAEQEEQSMDTFGYMQV